MIRTFIITHVLFVLAGCTQDGVPILVTNKSSTALFDKPVTLERALFEALPGTGDYPVITTEHGDTIPSQTDDTDQDGSWDEIFVVMNFKPREQIRLRVSWSPQPVSYPHRTSIRFGKRDSPGSKVYPKIRDTLEANAIAGRIGFQPYQTDGPSWENDKAGFRHYFDGRNSKDLFGKTTSEITPEEVGINADGAVEDNFHVLSEWGRDVLPTASSAGLGGINLLIGDSLSRIGNLVNDTTTNVERSIFTILHEGPVRSRFTIEHQNWRPFDRTYQIRETTTIWPGMYAFQNTVQIDGLKGNETLLVGLVNSMTTKDLNELILEDFVVLYTHDKQTYDHTWWLGLGLILPKESYLGYGKAPDTGIFSQSYFGELKIADKPATYYAVGCWELSDPGFVNKQYFEEYLMRLVEQLTAQVEVERIN